jgi:hypothetical protein
MLSLGATLLIVMHGASQHEIGITSVCCSELKKKRSTHERLVMPAVSLTKLTSCQSDHTTDSPSSHHQDSAVQCAD